MPTPLVTVYVIEEFGGRLHDHLCNFVVLILAIAHHMSLHIFRIFIDNLCLLLL